MTVLKCGFFNSSGGDRVYDAEDFSRYLEGIVANGCFPSDTGFKVVQNGASIGADPPSVIVSAGKAYYNGMWAYNDEDYIYYLGETQPISATTFLLYFCFDTNDSGRIVTIECISGTSPACPMDSDGRYYMPIASIPYSPATQPVDTNNDWDRRLYAGVAATTVDTTSLLDKVVTTPKIADFAVGLGQIAKTGIFLGEISPSCAGVSFMPPLNTWIDFTANGVLIAQYTPPVDVYLIITGGLNGVHYAVGGNHHFTIGVDVNGTVISVATCALATVVGGAGVDFNPFSIPFSKAIPLTAGVSYSMKMQMMANLASQRYRYIYVYGTMMAIPR